jgi:phosphatidylglycerol:prolipoprotein diacylglycerol transferase
VLLLLTIPWFRAEAWEIPLPAVGGLPPFVAVHPFGLLVAAGVILGALIAEMRAERVGIAPQALSGLSAWVLVAGFLLAHAFDAIAYHPDIVAERPLFVLEFWNGISSFGGFFGAIVGALIWQRRNTIGGVRPSIRVAADPIAFSFPFGWLFGRLGCFVTHDHPGRVTTFFLGVEDYEVGFPPYQVRHDLGLYEVLWSLAMIALFVWLARKEQPRGLFLGLLPTLYAPVRFGLDFLRATDLEQSDARYFGLTPGHYSAIALGALGLMVLVQTFRDPKPEVPEVLRPRASASPVEQRVAEEPEREARAVRSERPEEAAAKAERVQPAGLDEHGEGLGDGDRRPPRQAE